MTNFYLIQMSRGHGIPIDENELPNVIKGIQSKQPVIVRRGIFNPSFFVSIIEDHDRTNGWNRDLGNDKLIFPNKKQLPDMFENARENLNKLLVLSN